MKKILLSVMVVAMVAAAVVGVTQTYFSDTESSEDNIFIAGSLDLKVDYEGYHNKDVDGVPNAGDWELTDLNESHQFFNFIDVKPGDYGEGTVSIHLEGNPAWVRAVIDDLHNDENVCTEPEAQEDGTCGDPGHGEGELAANLYFWAWVDEGAIDGWQGQAEDPTEGDNIWQPENEPELMPRGPASSILPDGVAWELGVLEGSVTQYIGIGWVIPGNVTNIIQTDSLTADIRFEAVQERHNPVPVWPTP